jgi:hypothetical protein
MQAMGGTQREASSMMSDTYDQNDNVNDEPSNTNDDLEGSDIDDESDAEDFENDSDADEVDDDSDTDNDVDDEASRYLKTLIRRHLRTIMEDFQAPEPPTVQQIEISTVRDFMIQMIIAGLEQDHDTMLAYLVRAAVDVGRTATVERLETIDGFLQRTVNTIMGVGATEGRAFLQSVLEHLLRKDGSETDALSSRHSSEFERVSGVIVTIGNDTMQVAFDDILSFFWSTQLWSTQLDTTCHQCHRAFVQNEPPIRTIAQYEQNSSTSNVHIRLFNRHFSCLEETGTFFVPVSHVWDDSIRRANESKIHDDEAASTLIGTLKALFEGAEEAYQPGVEFWHDYFSVPQWEPETKDSLLLRIPAIYHLAEEILVHMSDFTSPHVWLLLIGNHLGAEITLLQALNKVLIFRALCESQWMKRMWVTLEYAQSRAACLMDQSNHIHRTPDGNGLFARDSFSQLVSGAHGQLLGLFRHAKTFARSLSLPGDFLGGIANRETGPRQLCLGEAVEVVAKKECFLFRDRFIAIHILINGNMLHNNSLPLPIMEIDACAQVWRSALVKNDYSPLLLQPRECVVASNPGTGVPSFLVGHRSLDGAEWNLGNLKAPPRRPLIGIDPVVQAELDLVGEIEKIHYLGVEDSGEIAGVDWVIRLLYSMAQAEGTLLSPEKLVDGLNRVFPFDMVHKEAARLLVDMVLTFRQRQEQDDEFESSLEEQLESYSTAPEGEDGSHQRREAAAKISQILQLDKHIMGEISDQITRLTRSRHIARRRRDRGVVNGEAICEVRCPGCQSVTLFRLDLRDTAGVRHKVFRIQGLSYSEGVEDGVGLVINNGRITGRMFYGPPACDCHLPETMTIN